MPKILYIITQSELGGAQKNVLDLASGLKDKYEILVAAGNDGGGIFFHALEKNKIRFIQLKFLRRAIQPITDFRAILEIKSLINKEQPNIVHLHSSKAGVLGSVAAKISKYPPKTIYTVHGAVFEASFKSFWRRCFLWLEKYTSRFKDKIICVSENDQKLWLKHNAAPAQKLIVIHNGIDLGAKIIPKDQAREELFSLSQPLFEAASGSVPDLKIIGTIANFYPEKGLPFLIQAAEIIFKNKEFKNLIFAVIGDGLERELLESMIQEKKLENKFVLAGKIPHAGSYLKAFDIFVLPSVKEGLPYTILEAMRANIPIIASYVGGVPEMIDNEYNGFLILPKSPEMLAERIIKLLKNPELSNHFIQNSQTKIKEFSLEKMIEETEKIYQS